MRYYLWDLGGYADHTREDRIRGTCALLEEQPELVTDQVLEDHRYGLSAVAGLRDRLPKLKKGELCLTGRPERGRRLGRSGVLWDWSAGCVPQQIPKGLDRFRRVVVSERMSLETLSTAGLGKKACLGPDPSFLVSRQIRPLRGAFREDTVGLCLSPAACRYETWDGLLFRSYQALIRYLLGETSFQIALIPYCVHPRRDDRLLHSTLAMPFLDSGRIHLRPDGSSQGLRGDLSLCRMVVGMSGAAAAWSCGVPALCLGRSPRATALSVDLFGSWSQTVVPIASLTTERDLTERFQTFLRREDSLRKSLSRSVPQRRQYAAQWKAVF